LANDIGGDGKTCSKRGFGGFRGARRLHLTTPAVDYVTEPEEVAQGSMPWNPDRRHRHRFEGVALPHLDAAYALARCLTRNDADAADVVQEAYLRAFRYFDSYRDGDAKSWLLQIVRRTCYTWLERFRPADVVSLEAEAEFGDVLATASSDAQRLLESRSDLRRLDQLIEALPAPLRETIVLRELHELGYREIAEVTGVPIGTVMSRLHRVRSLLLRAWDTKETGDAGIGSRSPQSSPFPAAGGRLSRSR
jgi:RNA polymerase sigma-70 factor (ECF subfamily)